MFEPDSRYANLETAVHVARDGREITYVRRRVLPRGENMPLLVEHTFTDGDRLDALAARTLGSAEAFWRIADANNAMSPFDLEVVPLVLRIPIPGVD